MKSVLVLLAFAVCPSVALSDNLDPLNGGADINKLNQIPQVPNGLDHTVQIQTTPQIIPAPQQLYIAAYPQVAIRAYSKDELKDLRLEAAQELGELQDNGWQLSFEGLTAVLAWENEGTTNAEDLRADAIEHANRYFEILEEIEEITGDRAKALAQEEAYKKSLRIDTTGHYAVNVSDRTTPSPQPHSGDGYTPPPPAPEGKHCHDEMTTRIINVVIDAGFDDDGNPIKRNGYDVMETHHQVCD